MTLEEAVLAATMSHTAHYDRQGQRGCEVAQRADGSAVVTLYSPAGLPQHAYIVTSPTEAHLVITLEWLIPINLGWQPGPFVVTGSCPECGAAPAQVEPATWIDGFHCDDCNYSWS